MSGNRADHSKISIDAKKSGSTQGSAEPPERVRPAVRRLAERRGASLGAHLLANRHSRSLAKDKNERRRPNLDQRQAWSALTKMAD